VIVYTVTSDVEAHAAPEWLAWMRNSHIPEVLATGCFSGCRIAELEEPAPPPGYVTFVCEYTAPTAAILARYLEQFAPALRQSATARYGAAVRATRTVRRVIE
jgi:hypothetical protein